MDIEKYICSRQGGIDVQDLLVFPRFFEIETVHACNAKCRMCTIDTWPERTPIMKQNLFDKIVDELSDHRKIINTVTLCRDGEPLLDKKIESKISQLKKVGINNVVFSTNASLLDEERATSIINSGLDEVMFSVDGFTKNVFESIRVGLNYDEVKKNILNFLNIREKLDSSIKVRIRMIVQDLNYHEFENWKKYWKNQVRDTDKVYGRPVHSWGNQIDITKFKHKVSIVKAPVCIALWSTMIIHSDGTVPACSVDYKNSFLSGDLFHSTIVDLWHSKVLNHLRKQHITGNMNKIDICSDCYLWDPTTLIGVDL